MIYIDVRLGDVSIYLYYRDYRIEVEDLNDDMEIIAKLDSTIVILLCVCACVKS